jgi:hypothetical protein
LNLHEQIALVYKIETELVESGGELTKETEVALDLSQEAVADKVDSYAFVMDRCKALEDEYKLAADRYQKIAKSFSRLSERLKNNVKEAAVRFGVSEFQGHEWRFALRDSAPSLLVECPVSELPDELTETTVFVNPKNDLIKKALLAGIAVPGCRLTTSKTLNKYPKRKELK